MFQNVAIWGYWEGAGRLPGTREGDIAVNSIPNGWLWAIPLHDGTMSVGVVLHKDAVSARKGLSLEQILDEAIEQAPLVRDLVAPGLRTSEVYREQDYSYACDSFCGPGFYLVGDSACFLDPLLSSGVHLATFSALLAAASIASIERGEVSEAEGSTYFEKSYRQAYLRFLVFLSAFYDINRGRDSYFWEAQRITQQDVRPEDLKQAFLTLVTGLKDLSDARSDTRHMILQEMSRRIDENLNLRKDKDCLASLAGDRRDAADANARFFSSVEGMFALNREEAIDGIYVATEPHLRLARTDSAR
ncbi:MAG: tryptophan 7-halogenase [Acidobacteria bacterium]|nr:tryptophan 7-halogenase [Acidobacteriota bacterium]